MQKVLFKKKLVDEVYDKRGEFQIHEGGVVTITFGEYYTILKLDLTDMYEIMDIMDTYANRGN